MLKELFRKKKNSNVKLDYPINIPEHIAIIMDGNGRWAKKRNLPRNMGHKAGVEKIKTISKECTKIGVKYLTLYAFSTENWNRPEQEVSGLMDLIVFFLRNELGEMHENNFKIIMLGDISRLPDKPREEMLNAIKKTENNDGLHLIIALNYGSRDEIIQATKAISQKVLNGEIDIDMIDENIFSNHLYTKGIPDPDLMIRTSGEIRLSNYLLWQLAYSEFYFCDTFWPDFDEIELHKAIDVYSSRQRRFGKI